MGDRNDELLMAYGDGELGPDDRVRVETLLANDPESRTHLDIFRATGAPLAVLFGKPMLEPIPAHLVAFVLNYECGKPRRS